VVNDDAMRWLDGERRTWDVAIVDFPDPHSFSLGKLYTETFYRLLYRRIAPDGAIAVQSTSPRQAPRSYWCIAATLEAAQWWVRPYHASVPSFGDWGFILAAKHTFEVPNTVPEGCRYLSPKFMPTLFILPKDILRPVVETNRLNSQKLVRYYESEFES
jgi:spermidine synthase